MCWSSVPEPVWLGSWQGTYQSRECGSQTRSACWITECLRRNDLPTFSPRPILPIMLKNVQMNRLTENVFVAKLDWCVVPAPPTFWFLRILFRGVPAPLSIPKPDIILAADCVYFEPAFPLLVETLDELSVTSTEILFCYKKRRKV